LLRWKGTIGQALDVGREGGGKAKVKTALKGDPAPKPAKGGAKGENTAALKGAKGGAKGEDVAAPNAKRKKK